jgi:hypothetical protein
MDGEFKEEGRLGICKPKTGRQAGAGEEEKWSKKAEIIRDTEKGET